MGRTSNCHHFVSIYCQVIDIYNVLCHCQTYFETNFESMIHKRSFIKQNHLFQTALNMAIRRNLLILISQFSKFFLKANAHQVAKMKALVGLNKVQLSTIFMTLAFIVVVFLKVVKNDT